MTARVHPGSTLVPSVGEGVPPSPTSCDVATATNAISTPDVAGSSFWRDAETNTRDACAPRILLLAAFLLFVAFSPSRATEPDTFSPVVSYQYLDTHAEPGTTITSPIVSYQYFDWPGDENLTFQSSPNVSYFFSGGVSATLNGILRDTAAAPISGAAVVLMRYGTVFWKGATNASGTFTAANIPAANYTVMVTKAGYRTLVDNIAGYAGGNGTLSLVMATLPIMLPATDVNRTPPSSALGTTSTGSSLKGYSGGVFTTGVTLHPDRMTIVLTHGWTGKPEDWAQQMAGLILARTALTEPPNIVAWDWQTAAAGGLIDKIHGAAKEGRGLGEALQQALGTGYSQRIHFIGHSFGTIVNRYACDYLHASFPPDRAAMNSTTPWLASVTRPHVTLLDEAEVGSVAGSQVITSTVVTAVTVGGPAAVVTGATVATANWKSAIPKAARWVDNYISAVGIQHEGAVNVCLVKAAESTFFNGFYGVSNLVAAHGYAHEWYRQSIIPATIYPAPPMGFSRSFEKALTFPPNGAGATAGVLWTERTATADPLDMTLNTDPFFGEATEQLAAAFAVQSSKKIAENLVGGVTVFAGQVVQAGEAAALGLANTANDYLIKPADAVGRAVMEGYTTGITVAGEIGGTAIYKTGLVITETKEKVGNMIDATQDFAANTTVSLDPDSLQLGPVTIPFMRIRLMTQAAPQFAAKRSALAAAAAGQPAYAWMTVHVPANAGYLAFDFTVTGQPVEDRIVCAINDQNVFNLPAKFAPDNVPSSTDLIDVSAFAGQDIELFFGLAGGTSTNCEVAIDGVRFITVPQPKIGIVDAGPDVLLKWPAAAAGWILEESDSLAPANWQPVPMGAGVAVDSGVITFQQPKAGEQRFYRLKRTP